MRIGVPREIKSYEFRVGLIPAGVKSLVDNGHQVVIEKDAGLDSGFTNEQYIAEGAEISEDLDYIWGSDIVVKVKEPLEEEYKYFREGLILFTYLHLAADAKLTEALLKNKVISIAYETVTDDKGTLPLLTPMSMVAGRMSVQIAANLLTKQNGGSGTLLGGVPGVSKGKVAIIGGGVVGTNAAKIAIGLGADVSILDVNAKRLSELSDLFGNGIQTLMSNSFNIQKVVKHADVLIGAVLIPGAKAPTLVTEDMIATMKDGSIIIDVAVDQGGIVETIDRTTTHTNPVYIKHGVLHYAVPNMPGSVSRTSTIALTNVTTPFLVELANKGYEQLFAEDEHFRNGLNTFDGYVTNRAVAESLGKEYREYK